MTINATDLRDNDVIVTGAAPGRVFEVRVNGARATITYYHGGEWALDAAATLTIKPRA